jgi:hypothetical protein
MSSRLR